ncbi:MAG: ComEC/Rec2 family competence protein [Oscillospiraceae bacterium]|jgi:competence protein ComEC|nr:ComEC/Rec2 family competence protein [Oscillospiraceae bacterium]
MSRPFAVVGFTMLLTLAALFFLPEWAVFPALALSALGFAAALLLRRRHNTTAFAAAFGAAMAACVLLLGQLAMVYYPTIGQTGEKLPVRAQILSNGNYLYGKYYYTIRTTTISDQPSRLKLRLVSPYPVYAKPYDEITFSGTIFILGDYEVGRMDAYKATGLYLGVYPTGRSEDRFEVTHRRGFYPMRAVLWMQRNIRQNIRAAYTRETAALLEGMLLGDTGNLSWLAQEEFRWVGISHLFSVSGLHLSLLAWSVYRALRAAKCSRRACALSAMGFVLFFIALTGFQASCVRAGVMMLVLLSGRLFYRRADSLNSLGLAAAVLMAVSPLSAGQLGLELSFGATLGILLFRSRLAAPGERLLKRWKAAAPLKRPLRAANNGLAITASALALTTPIQMLRLPNGASLLVFLANLLFVPLSSLLITLGGLSALLPSFAKALSPAAEPLGAAISRGVHALDQIPAPVLRGSGTTVAFALAACALFAAAALLLRYWGRPLRLRYTAGLLSAALILGCWLPLQSTKTKAAKLATGEGIMVFVSRGKQAALLGCGGSELPARAAKQALSAAATGQLQLLLIPGKGSEFSAAAAELARDLQIRRILRYDEVTQPYTPFSLWEGARGIFFCQGGNAACLLQMNGAQYTLLFSGALPAEWQGFPPLISSG